MAPDAAQLAELASLVAAGELELAPETVTVNEAPEAFKRVTTGTAGGAKLVLTI